MAITSLDHCHIGTRDLGGTIVFYRGVLGLTLGNRPLFDIPDAWMCVNGRPMIRIDALEEADMSTRSQFVPDRARFPGGPSQCPKL
jgi:catechol 2,3-dioxygenase-like lactoylglutathione lyase family enzyme